MGTYVIGLLGHSAAGKTTIGEALLHAAGVLKKPGSVDNGTSLLDWEPIEREKGNTVHTGLAHFSSSGHKVDLLDTPGSLNFLGSTVGAIRVMDGAMLVVSAEPGVQSQTEILWERLSRRNVARMVVVNQMDREQADFSGRLESLREMFGPSLVPVVLPMGTGANFKGIIDLVTMKALDFSEGSQPKIVEIPAEFTEEADQARARLMEAAAEGDDKLMGKYLETETLDKKEITTGLLEATSSGKVVPIFCMSAALGVGTSLLLETVFHVFPDFSLRQTLLQANENPGPGYVPDSAENGGFSALVFASRIDHFAGKLSMIRVLSGKLSHHTEILNVSTDAHERPAHLFKIQGKNQVEVDFLEAGELGALPKLTHTQPGNSLSDLKNPVEFIPIAFPQPVLTYALELPAKGEEEKVSSALHKMMEEDPTLSFHHEPETGDFLVSGLGQIHLELVLERLINEFHIKATFGEPHVPYRETIRGSAKAQGRYKKQTGGRGQYGDCWLEIKPKSQEEDLSFHNKIVGGVIPRQFIPAVEKGVTESMEKGVLAQFPVIGIDVTVFDGSFHNVDSSEMAFKIAGSIAFKNAMDSANPVLLEPVMTLEVIVQTDYMGDVMGDISARRGKVLGMETNGRNQVVRAEVPMSEILKYAVELRAMTHGQGRFTQGFSHYQEVPTHQAEKIIQSRRSKAS